MTLLCTTKDNVNYSTSAWKKAMVDKIKNVPWKRGKISNLEKLYPIWYSQKNVGVGADVKSQRCGEHKCF